jgi:hypothetical protein
MRIVKRRVELAAPYALIVLGLLLVADAVRADGVWPTAALAVPVFAGVTMFMWAVLDTVPGWVRQALEKVPGAGRGKAEL